MKKSDARKKNEKKNEKKHEKKHVFFPKKTRNEKNGFFHTPMLYIYFFLITAPQKNFLNMFQCI